MICRGLEEMIAEVDQGNKSIQRKLSLDINSFIPEFVGNWERRARMTSITRVGFGKPVRPIPANVPREWRE
jgi:plastocyanin domain-containing protein